MKHGPLILSLHACNGNTELGDWTAELDGSEDDCVFGPVADLPVDTDEFDDLPAPGEWSQL